MVSASDTFRSVVLCGLAVATWHTPPVLHADDWPQWRGAQRDGVWRESGIVDTVPDELQVRWRTRIGRGYSGPVVADGRVFVTDHRFEPELERVLCFDEETGELLWSHAYAVDYEDMEYGNGPRASPTVHEGRVYTLGTQADLCCLDAATGELFWQKDLVQEYNAEVPQYGASVAPLVEGDLLIVCAGGQPAASVVALDRLTGEERWTALDDRPAYSAPIVVDRGGVRQAIVWTADKIISLDPESGDIYWQEPWKTTFDPAQVVANPVLHGDRLLFVMAWARGSRMLELDADRPAFSVLWKTRSRPTTTMSTPIFIDDDHFCSIDNAGGLCCQDANSGDEVWRTSEVAGSGALGHAHLTPNGDRVFLFNQRGQLISARLTPDGYEETGRTLLVEPTPGHRAQGPVAWAHPAYANKHVIARNDRELLRVSLDAGDYRDASVPTETDNVASALLPEFQSSSAALCVDASADGETIAFGTWSGQVKLFAAATREALDASPPGIRNNCSAVAISPDGGLLAYGGGSEFEQASNNYQRSGKLKLWDLTEKASRGDFAGHTSKVTSLCFSPDGAILASGSADNTIKLWDVATGEVKATLAGHIDAVWALSFLPDGQTLVSVGWDRTLRIWDTEDRSELKSVSAHDEEILSLAVTSEGSLLATGSADWTIRLWDTDTLEPTDEFRGHTGAVYGLVFSPDGATLASGSGDETVKLWDVSGGREERTLRGHNSGVVALDFTPDGETLVTCGRDDAVRFWNVSGHTLKETDE